MVLLAAIALTVIAACREPTDPARTDELLPENMVQFDAVIVDVLPYSSGAEVLVDSTGRAGDPHDYAGRLALLVRDFTVVTRADGSAGTVADLVPGIWVRATTGSGEFRSIPPKRYAARVVVVDAPPDGSGQTSAGAWNASTLLARRQRGEPVTRFVVPLAHHGDGRLHGTRLGRHR